MGLFRRALSRVREWFSDDTPRREDRPAEQPPPIGGPFVPPPKDLPPGWRFEGLYYSTRPEDQRRVINHHPSDREVSSADSIIVSYTDGLGTIYRTIHGANSRKDVGKLIGRVITVVSPPR